MKEGDGVELWLLVTRMTAGSDVRDNGNGRAIAEGSGGRGVGGGPEVDGIVVLISPIITTCGTEVMVLQVLGVGANIHVVLIWCL